MKKHSGLSLVELMIAITIGLVLMTGVVQMFLSSKAIFSTQQGLSRIQETGRLALEFMGRDLRMASYYGCARTENFVSGYNINDNALVKGGLHETFRIGLRGYDSGASVQAALPHGVAVDLGAAIVPEANSDILVIRGSNERGLIGNTDNMAAIAYGYTPETSIVNNCIDGICIGGVVAIANCQSGDLVTVADLNLTGSTLAVTVAPALNAGKYIASNYTILPVHTTAYFIATGTGGEPSLWQKIDTQNAVELLQGVEQMRIRYSNDGVTFNRAQNIPVANWESVPTIPQLNRVSIELLIRGTDINNLSTPQPITFDGVAVPAATVADRRIRKIFKSSFYVRTR